MKVINKLELLKDNIRRFKKVMIAFSGGTDSSFLLAVSAKALGKDNIVAATAYSETYTESELSSAKEIAKKTGVRHVIIETSELDDPAFSSNPYDRCYHCKKEFYLKLISAAKEMSIKTILDGSNADDTSDYRPGRLACHEFGIISPLMEEGLNKDDIRTFSRELDLPTWNKPANPCLASRIPYGNKITKEKLETIAGAEAFIRKLGFSTLRVRHHGEIARIEIPEEDLSRFMQNETREKADNYLKSLGFIWVSIDIAGFRTGSLNRAIKNISERSDNK